MTTTREATRVTDSPYLGDLPILGINGTGYNKARVGADIALGRVELINYTARVRLINVQRRLAVLRSILSPLNLFESVAV